MARRKKRKEWMAIVTVGNEPKPIVIMDADYERLTHVATFASVEDIEALSMDHMLSSGVWTAFNFATGEAVVL